ncbi:hypothetical protein ACFQJD_09390 [Haloplanus sp. GCM10025708]|uniref:hypothetical protein n=1 Tax=Haloferacaceae TaxID=1644056 RepID=UPI00361FC867
MPSGDETEPEWARSLRSRAYEFTLEEGPESMFALSIEETDCETAWLISDTVVSLERMR